MRLLSHRLLLWIITRTEFIDRFFFEFIPMISSLFFFFWKRRKMPLRMIFVQLLFDFFFQHLFRELRNFFFFSRENICTREDSEFAFKEVNFGDKVARTCSARKEMLRKNWWKPISHSRLRDTMYLWSWWIYSWSLEVLFSFKEK